MTPTYVLPGSALAGGGADGAAVTFNLGNVKNLATDGSSQLIVIEFNALVDNVRGNTAGHPLNNSFTVDVAGVQSGNPSNTVTTTVVEPKLTLTKAVKDQTDGSTTTGDAGDVVQYTYTLKNTGNATAFNVNLADVLPTDLGGAGGLTVSVTGGAATGQDTSGTAGNNLSVLFASLNAGATVTVTYTATIQNTVTPQERLDSTASATWTSLPGANGTTVNPTGSATPGAPGSATGERTAPGVGAPNPPDNYLASKDAPLTVLAPPSLQKVVASTSLAQTTGNNVAVGETVTYDMTFTLSEATYATLGLTDALPTGLTYISSQVDAIGANISGSALAVGASGALSGQNVVFQFTDATHIVVDAADNTAGPQHQIVVQVVAAVANVAGNTNGAVLTNDATLNYGPGVLTASAPITVVEPQLTVTKTTNKATADAGEPITYTVTVKNTSPAVPAFNVDLTDLLDLEHLTLDSIGALPPGVTLAAGPAGEVHVVVAELDAGQSVSFQYVAQIQGPPTAGAPAPGAAVPNTATVNSFTTLPVGGRTEPAVSGGASVTVNSSTISGYVYNDSADNNGLKESGEAGLGSVRLTLTGHDDLGNPVSLTTTTNASGFYQFTNLRPSDGSGYTISQDDATLPPGYLDGKNQAGDLGGAFGGAAGAVLDDAIRSIVIPADSNQTQTDYNFGKLQPAAASGYSYQDVNDNGLRAAGEPGIGSVAVTLSGSNDLGAITSITVQTDVNGYYHFDGLRPGLYTVAETPPAGYLNGLKTRGDVTPIPNSVAANAIMGVAVSAGGVAAENDFAHLNPASLTGYVYRDDNNDGRQDNGEPGIAGVTVTLSGVDDQGNAVPAGTTAITDANGNYQFDNLRPGTYTVTETQPVQYAQGQNAVGQVTLTQAGQTFAAGAQGPGVDVLSGVQLAEGDAGVQYDFGERGASVSGTVYLDGVPANGLGGVTVTLADGRGALLSTTTTDGSGHYHFDNLPAGPYTLVETVPTGVGAYAATPLYVVGSPTTLSVALPTTGLTNENFDLNTASLAGTVYQDVNDNDALDGGDARLTGVLVTLTGTDVAGNVVNRTLPTDGSGNYDFTGLLPADAAGYTLTKTTPAGYIDNPQTVGMVAGGADGVLPPTGFSAINAVALSAGQSGVGYNFGEVLPSTLAGFVYADANDNGVFQPGAPNNEQGLGGVTVTLTGFDDRSNPVSATATTKPDGSYSLGGLRPAGAGGYTLTESPPPGPTAYLPGTDGLGADQNGRAVGGTVGTRVLSAIPLGQGVNGRQLRLRRTQPRDRHRRRLPRLQRQWYSQYGRTGRRWRHAHAVGRGRPRQQRHHRPHERSDDGRILLHRPAAGYVPTRRDAAGRLPAGPQSGRLRQRRHGRFSSRRPATRPSIPSSASG